MIALLVASILIGMVFSVYTRLSVGYRAQSQVSELQQSLRAAKMNIEREIRAAGHMMPGGIQVNGSIGLLPPLVIENNIAPTVADFSPDLIRVYYADATAMAMVTGRQSPIAVTVDSVDNFVPGQLIAAVNARTLTAESADVAPIAGYDVCLLYITNTILTPNPSDDDIVEFAAAGAPINVAGDSINTATNDHCADALDTTRGTPPMLYHFTGRAYRINPAPANRATGILEMSPSGALLANDWQIIGVGFTNLQLAARYYEDSDLADVDSDGDPTRDWYSGSVAPPVGAVPTSISVSLEVRTTHRLDLVPTSATPMFAEFNKDPNHNRIGDWGSIALAGVADASRPEQYRGSHIYRWSTTTVDIRNVGVGR